MRYLIKKKRKGSEETRSQKINSVTYTTEERI